jgi:hypothetical protein
MVFSAATILRSNVTPPAGERLDEYNRAARVERVGALASFPRFFLVDLQP